MKAHLGDPSEVSVVWRHITSRGPGGVGVAPLKPYI
jgi:hypothetical protein